MAFGQVTYDAQKTMGIIALSLVIGGVLPTFQVPTWVVVVSAAAIAIASLSGTPADLVTTFSTQALAAPQAGEGNGDRPTGTVWVVNRDLGQLVIFDAATGEQLTTPPLPVGRGAHDILDRSRRPHPQDLQEGRHRETRRGHPRGFTRVASKIVTESPSLREKVLGCSCRVAAA